LGLFNNFKLQGIKNSLFRIGEAAHDGFGKIRRPGGQRIVDIDKGIRRPGRFLVNWRRGRDTEGLVSPCQRD